MKRNNSKINDSVVQSSIVKRRSKNDTSILSNGSKSNRNNKSVHLQPYYQQYLKEVKDMALNQKQDTTKSYLKRKNSIKIIVDEHSGPMRSQLRVTPQYESDSFQVEIDQRRKYEERDLTVSSYSANSNLQQKMQTPIFSARTLGNYAQSITIENHLRPQIKVSIQDVDSSRRSSRRKRSTVNSHFETPSSQSDSGDYSVGSEHSQRQSVKKRREVVKNHQTFQIQKTDSVVKGLIKSDSISQKTDQRPRKKFKPKPKSYHAIVTTPSAQKLFQYDYGYTRDPKKKKQSLQIEPGENLYGLGGKLVNTPQQVQTHKIENENIFPDESFTEMPIVEPPKKQFIDPVKYMEVNEIQCIKFNYSVPQSYDDKAAIIELTEDEEFLNIYNYNNNQKDGLIIKIKIDSITGFIYGSFSTRFWMMRIGINQKIVDNFNSNGDHREKDAELPFYAWQCVSLQMKDRDIDLVIQDDKHLKIFLQFLIIKLNTHNGLPNSIKVMQDKKMLKQNKTVIDMVENIYVNFLIMKIRMKISYEACRTNKTIQELFLSAILETYKERNKQNLIVQPYPSITKAHLDALKTASIKDLTNKGIMQEAKKIESQKLKRKGTQEEGCLNKELHTSKGGKKFASLVQQVLKCDDIDDLFWKHYQSSDEDKNLFAEEAVKLSKSTGQVMTFEETQKEDAKTERAILAKAKKKFMFKKKVAIAEKRANYDRLQMIINLRVIEGPLFIYALLERVNLSKAILALKLEQGVESLIPPELGQKHLPLTFQYYDSILHQTREKISPQQKQFLFRFHKHRKEFQEPQDVQISLKERISRWYKRVWRELPEFQDDASYKLKLQMYEECHSIQNARYLTIDHNNLRVVQKGQGCRSDLVKSLHNHHHHGKDDGHHHHDTLSTSFKIDLKSIKTLDQKALNDPKFQIDLDYLTQHQVGRKRAEVFLQKVQYQNQLMSLKEKGRRLLICNRIEQEQLQLMNNVLQDEDIIGEKQNVRRQLTGSAFAQQSTKEKFEQIIDRCNNFEIKSVLHQENNTIQMRKRLKQNIEELKQFHLKNEYIDKKIEYDQRFYNDGYAEFQLMISDIRKQIRLNNEVMKLRKRLSNVYGQICNSDHSHKHTEEEEIYNQYQEQKQKLDEMKNKVNINSMNMIERLEKKQKEVERVKEIIKKVEDTDEMNWQGTVQPIQGFAKVRTGSIANSGSYQQQLSQRAQQRLSTMNKDDPISARATRLRSGIDKLRSRIRCVSVKSQQALWGKNGGYDPIKLDETKSMLESLSKKLKSQVVLQQKIIMIE